MSVHIPDGYIDLATSAGAGLVAAGGLGVALKTSKRQIAERQIPLAGLTAAFLFVLQMLNFPVAAGTSGHLLGGALAAILLGPALGTVVVGVVVICQAFLFADGGVSALGLNVVNMAVLPVALGWGVFRVVTRLAPKNSGAVIGATMAAGWVSMMASSTAFVLEYALGGQGGVALQTVFWAMTGVHAVIGIGEGLISGVVVGTVLATRPDLIRGIHDRVLTHTASVPSRRAVGGFVTAGLTAAFVLVLVLAPLASPAPDGLERVAADTGFASTAKDHRIEGPLTGYEVTGVRDERTGTVVAGVIGVGVTFIAGLGLVALSRRRDAA